VVVVVVVRGGSEGEGAEAVDALHDALALEFTSVGFTVCFLLDVGSALFGLLRSVHTTEGEPHTHAINPFPKRKHSPS
jgi:hypothetical protein